MSSIKYLSNNSGKTLLPTELGGIFDSEPTVVSNNITTPNAAHPYAITGEVIRRGPIVYLFFTGTSVGGYGIASDPIILAEKFRPKVALQTECQMHPTVTNSRNGCTVAQTGAVVMHGHAGATDIAATNCHITYSARNEVLGA